MRRTNKIQPIGVNLDPPPGFLSNNRMVREDVVKLEQQIHNKLAILHNENEKNKNESSVGGKINGTFDQIKVLDFAINQLCQMIEIHSLEKAKLLSKVWSSASDLHDRIYKEVSVVINDLQFRLMEQTEALKKVEYSAAAQVKDNHNTLKEQVKITGSLQQYHDLLAINRKLEEDLLLKNKEMLELQQTLTHLSLWFPNFSRFAPSILTKYLPPVSTTFQDEVDEYTANHDASEIDKQEETKSDSAIHEFENKFSMERYIIKFIRNNAISNATVYSVAEYSKVLTKPTTTNDSNKNAHDNSEDPNNGLDLLIAAQSYLLKDLKRLEKIGIGFKIQIPSIELTNGGQNTNNNSIPTTAGTVHKRRDPSDQPSSSIPAKETDSHTITVVNQDSIPNGVYNLSKPGHITEGDDQFRMPQFTVQENIDHQSVAQPFVGIPTVESQEMIIIQQNPTFLIFKENSLSETFDDQEYNLNNAAHEGENLLRNSLLQNELAHGGDRATHPHHLHPRPSHDAEYDNKNMNMVDFFRLQSSKALQIDLHDRINNSEQAAFLTQCIYVDVDETTNQMVFTNALGTKFILSNQHHRLFHMDHLSNKYQRLLIDVQLLETENIRIARDLSRERSMNERELNRMQEEISKLSEALKSTNGDHAVLSELLPRMVYYPMIRRHSLTIESLPLETMGKEPNHGTESNKWWSMAPLSSNMIRDHSTPPPNPAVVLSIPQILQHLHQFTRHFVRNSDVNLLQCQPENGSNLVVNATTGTSRNEVGGPLDNASKNTLTSAILLSSIISHDPHFNYDFSKTLLSGQSTRSLYGFGNQLQNVLKLSATHHSCNSLFVVHLFQYVVQHQRQWLDKKKQTPTMINPLHSELKLIQIIFHSIDYHFQHLVHGSDMPVSSTTESVRLLNDNNNSSSSIISMGGPSRASPQITPRDIHLTMLEREQQANNEALLRKLQFESNKQDADSLMDSNLPSNKIITPRSQTLNLHPNFDQSVAKEAFQYDNHSALVITFLRTFLMDSNKSDGTLLNPSVSITKKANETRKKSKTYGTNQKFRTLESSVLIPAIINENDEEDEEEDDEHDIGLSEKPGDDGFHQSHYQDNPLKAKLLSHPLYSELRHHIQFDLYLIGFKAMKQYLTNPSYPKTGSFPIKDLDKILKRMFSYLYTGLVTFKKPSLVIHLSSLDSELNSCQLEENPNSSAIRYGMSSAAVAAARLGRLHKSWWNYLPKSLFKKLKLALELSAIQISDLLPTQEEVSINESIETKQPETSDVNNKSEDELRYAEKLNTYSIEDLKAKSLKKKQKLLKGKESLDRKNPGPTDMEGPIIPNIVEQEPIESIEVEEATPSSSSSSKPLQEYRIDCHECLLKSLDSIEHLHTELMLTLQMLYRFLNAIVPGGSLQNRSFHYLLNFILQHKYLPLQIEIANIPSHTDEQSPDHQLPVPMSQTHQSSPIKNKSSYHLSISAPSTSDRSSHVGISLGVRSSSLSQNNSPQFGSLSISENLNGFKDPVKAVNFLFVKENFKVQIMKELSYHVLSPTVHLELADELDSSWSYLTTLRSSHGMSSDAGTTSSDAALDAWMFADSVLRCQSDDVMTSLGYLLPCNHEEFFHHRHALANMSSLHGQRTTKLKAVGKRFLSMDEIQLLEGQILMDELQKLLLEQHPNFVDLTRDEMRTTVPRSAQSNSRRSGANSTQSNRSTSNQTPFIHDSTPFVNEDEDYLGGLQYGLLCFCSGLAEGSAPTSEGQTSSIQQSFFKQCCNMEEILYPSEPSLLNHQTHPDNLLFHPLDNNLGSIVERILMHARLYFDENLLKIRGIHTMNWSENLTLPYDHKPYTIPSGVRLERALSIMTMKYFLSIVLKIREGRRKLKNFFNRSLNSIQDDFLADNLLFTQPIDHEKASQSVGRKLSGSQDWGVFMNLEHHYRITMQNRYFQLWLKWIDDRHQYVLRKDEQEDEKPVD